jgi:hypothetical protein
MNWKSLFRLIFIGNILLAVLALFVLPERVAIHFAGDGLPDSWSSKYFHTICFMVTDVLLFLLMYYLPQLILIFPARYINLPNRDYWLQEQNRDELKVKLGELIWEYGTFLFTFLFVAGFLAIMANLSDPVRLNLSLFLPVFIIFMIYTIYWIIKLIRSFKIPGNGTAPSS